MLHNFFIHHYLLMLLFLLSMGFLAGFIDAIAGGGGLISIPALSYVGLPVAVMFGTNKFQSSVGTSMAVFKYYKGGLINFKTIYRGLLMGSIGAILGAYLVNHISNHFMQFVIPFLLLAVFIFNLFNRNMGIHPGNKKLQEVTFFSIFGFILGFYDAFFGPGTGNFWIIAIVFFLGYTFLEASGYAKVMNLKSNLFSLAVFLYYGKVKFILGLVMGLGSFCGGYLGAHSVMLKGSKLVRPFFMTIVFVNVMIAFYQMIFIHSSMLG